QLKEVSTVQEVLDTCRKLDETSAQRISQSNREFPRLQSVLQAPIYPEPTTVISAACSTSPSAFVEEIVRRVLEQLQSAPIESTNVAAVRPQRLPDTRQCYYCHRISHVERSQRDIVHVSPLKPFYPRRPEDVASGGGY